MNLAERPELLYGGGAVAVLLVVLLASKGGSGGSAPGFDKARGDYNVKLYTASADRDVKARAIQADVDKEVVRAGVSVTGIRADAQAKADSNRTARDLGMRSLDIQEGDSIRRNETQRYTVDRQAAVAQSQIGAQREVGLFQAQTARDLGGKQLDYGYALGQQQNANTAQRNQNDLQVSQMQNETEQNGQVFDFFGNLFGGIFKLIGLG